MITHKSSSLLHISPPSTWHFYSRFRWHLGHTLLSLVPASSELISTQDWIPRFSPTIPNSSSNIMGLPRLVPRFPAVPLSIPVARQTSSRLFTGEHTKALPMKLFSSCRQIWKWWTMRTEMNAKPKPDKNIGGSNRLSQRSDAVDRCPGDSSSTSSELEIRAAIF